MTDAPKIDTQAPGIGMTTGIDFGTGKDTTMLTLMIDGKLHHASTDGPWGQAILALLAERDLADARAAAAAQAMREAAAMTGHAQADGNTRHAVLRSIRDLPLPDPDALDRLIAERVREARTEAFNEAASIARAEVERQEAAMEKAVMCVSILRLSAEADAAERIAIAIVEADRGSKEGQS